MADLDPHHGEVCLGEICAHDVSAPHWRKMLGLLPSESAWWYDTVAEHFTDRHFNLQPLHLPVQAMQWDIARLSTGEKQRLAVARLLSVHPKALLLDEPSANLDHHNVAAVEQVIRDYRQSFHCPVLWVSHDGEQIRRLADRVVRIQNGQFAEQSA